MQLTIYAIAVKRKQKRFWEIEIEMASVKLFSIASRTSPIVTTRILSSNQCGAQIVDQKRFNFGGKGKKKKYIKRAFSDFVLASLHFEKRLNNDNYRIMCFPRNNDGFHVLVIELQYYRNIMPSSMTLVLTVLRTSFCIKFGFSVLVMGL
jgi:hypothetical protein